MPLVARSTWRSCRPRTVARTRDRVRRSSFLTTPSGSRPSRMLPLVIVALGEPYPWWALARNALPFTLLVAPSTWRYVSWPRRVRRVIKGRSRSVPASAVSFDGLSPWQPDHGPSSAASANGGSSSTTPRPCSSSACGCGWCRQSAAELRMRPAQTATAATTTRSAHLHGNHEVTGPLPGLRSIAALSSCGCGSGGPSAGYRKASSSTRRRSGSSTRPRRPSRSSDRS